MNPGPFDQLVKALAHRHRLLAIARGDFLPPASVKIELTTACNHACHFCAYRRIVQDRVHTSLDTERVLRLVDELAAQGTEGVMFTGGGEPLLHPGLESILGHCAERNLQTALLTNGVLLGRLGDETLRALRGLRFSINGGTAREYASVHDAPAGDWEKVWEQVSRVANKRHFPRLCVGVSLVATSRNVGSIGDAGRRAKESGADYLHVRPAFIGPHIELDRQLTQNEIAASLEELSALGCLEDGSFRIHGIRRRFDEIETPDRRNSHCRATPLVAYVLPGGELSICTLVRDCNFSAGDGNPFLGNLLNASFFELWNTPRHRRLIALLSRGGCRRCHFAEYNRALALVESDALHAAFL